MRACVGCASASAGRACAEARRSAGEAGAELIDQSSFRIAGAVGIDLVQSAERAGRDGSRVESTPGLGSRLHARRDTPGTFAVTRPEGASAPCRLRQGAEIRGFAPRIATARPLQMRTATLTEVIRMRRTLKHPVLLPVVGAAAGLLSSLAPTLAHADVCPTPTLAQCQTPEFYDTPCGTEQRVETSTCAILLQEDFDHQSADFPLEERRQPDTMVSAPTKLAVQTPAEVNQLTYVGKQSASGAPLFETYANWLTTMAVQELKGIAFTPPWANNGAAVTSCEEYAFDSAYDYARFEQATAQYGSDYRAIFDAAYADSPGAIAGQTLRDKAGEPMGWPVWPGDEAGGAVTLPKNIFFTAFGIYNDMAAKNAAIGIIPSWDPLEAFSASFTRAELQAGQNRWWRQNWAWHSNMNAVVSAAGISDDVLYQFDSKKEAFAELLAEREKAYQQALLDKNDPTCHTAGFGVECCDAGGECRTGASTLVMIADQKIVAALDEAKQLHCLDPNFYGCDWSPRTFVDMLRTEATRRRENDFQTCMTYSGNSFFEARNYTTSMGLEGLLTGDYTTTPQRFRTYLDAVKRTFAHVDYPKDPITKKPTLADIASDRGSFGIDDVKVTWGYDAFWKVIGYEGSQRLCNAHIDVSGNFNLKGKAWSELKELFNFKAHAWTDTAGGHLMYAVRVRDQQLYGGDITSRLAETIHIVKHKPFSGRYLVPGPHVSIFGIDIALNGGISAKGALDATLDVFGGRGCDTADSPNMVVFGRVDGNFTPSIDSSVFAEVSAGIPVLASVGVKADLQLVKATLPFLAGAKLSMIKNGATLNVLADLHTSAKLHLTALDGSLSVFAQLLIKRAEKVLFDWNGFTTDATLFDFESRHAIPLAVVKQLQGS